MQRYAGHDPNVCAHVILCKAQWLLGYPDQALDTAQNAVALATQLGHPFSLNQALHTAARIHLYRREPRESLAYLEQSQAVMRQDKASRHSAVHLAFRGFALGQLGSNAEAVALMQQGTSLWRKDGSNLELPEWLSSLAEICLQAGEVQSARQAIDEGLSVATTTGEEHFRPELHRLLGRCYLAVGDLNAAQASLQQALKLAQTQQTQSLHLRAALDLASLWEEQGRRVEAYELLNGIYTWFQEGHETTDLLRAQQLLLGLSP